LVFLSYLINMLGPDARDRLVVSELAARYRRTLPRAVGLA